MAYATFEDIIKRKYLETSEMERCDALLEDAAIIIDAYNAEASLDAKRLVSCNMVIRAIGNRDESIPIGATQGTMSALGYSQSWTSAGGSGELYLTKLEKKILGAGNNIGFSNPYSNIPDKEVSDD
jgi:hypothetical protein